MQETLVPTVSNLGSPLRWLLANGIPTQPLADRYGVSPSSIRSIRSRAKFPKSQPFIESIIDGSAIAGRQLRSCLGLRLAPDLVLHTKAKRRKLLELENEIEECSAEGEQTYDY